MIKTIILIKHGAVLYGDCLNKYYKSNSESSKLIEKNPKLWRKFQSPWQTPHRVSHTFWPGDYRPIILPGGYGIKGVSFLILYNWF